MEDLIRQRRPSPSLIKLIECVGTLLGVPLSKKKSPYKAPLPSNYDETLLVLQRDFYGVITKLAEMQSGVIEHDVATNFYNKMLEPGFDYEDAINNGGLIVRELHNAALLVLLKLQSDSDRVPVGIDNIFLLLDGTRASYAAFDLATHILRHGSLHVGLDTRYADPRLTPYMRVDVQRRCKSQYKLTDHTFAIHDLASVPQDITDIIPAIQQVVDDQKIQILALPVQRPQDFDTVLTQYEPILQWALSAQYVGDVVLTHGGSYMRPFTEATTPRTHLLYIPHHVNPSTIFMRALRFCRPGDAICVTSIFPSRTPLGDNRDLRFDFGHRHSWQLDATDEEKAAHPNSDRVGWNDDMTSNFEKLVQEMLQKSAGVTGFVRIERYDIPSSCSNSSSSGGIGDDGYVEDSAVDFLGPRSVSEKLLRVAQQEKCTSIIFHYGLPQPASEDDFRSTPNSPTRRSGDNAQGLESSLDLLGAQRKLAETRYQVVHEALLRGLLQQAPTSNTALVLLK